MQVHFYKRAQIFVADLWGAFHGVGLGQFDDIDQLTMFADYRVPQMLYGLGVLVYNQDLVDKIENRQEILPGRQFESVPSWSIFFMHNKFQLYLSLCAV